MAESRAVREARFEALVARAEAAGNEALVAATPTPMVVTETDVITGRPTEGGKSWYVSEGVCGFAWIKVRPGTSSFARWAVKNSPGWRKSYGGGIDRWVSEGRQSMTRKEAFARAYAEVLREAGINAYARSRMD